MVLLVREGNLGEDGRFVSKSSLRTLSQEPPFFQVINANVMDVGKLGSDGSSFLRIPICEGILGQVPEEEEIGGVILLLGFDQRGFHRQFLSYH